MKRFRIFTSVLAAAALLMPFMAAAQFYSMGTEPSRAKWMHIKSEHFNLIYPQETDSLARVYLYWLEKQRPVVNEPLAIGTKPIPTIIHPYSTMSNGSVSWAPKQLNLMTSPDPYGGVKGCWHQQLTTHELRHVGQSQHFTRGLWRWLYWFMGEQSTSVGMALFASSKYLEGDAVVAETENSLTGRGRSAEFTMQIRADLLNGVRYSWEQAAHGSYKNNSYGAYELGYLLVTEQRMRTDNYGFMGEFYRQKADMTEVWDILRSKNNKKKSCLGRSANLRAAQDMYYDIWSADYESRGEFTSFDTLSHQRRLHCDYWSPIVVHDSLSRYDGDVIALRKGKLYTEELVSIDKTGRTRHLRFHAPYSSKLSDAVGGRFYWSESVMHNSPSLENYSEIKYMDLRSDKVVTLTHGTKYFNPSVSEDGSLLAVSEYPIGETTRLVLLDAASGSPVASAVAPSGGQFKESLFAGGWLYATLFAEEGLSLLRIRPSDLSSGKWETVVASQSRSIDQLRRRDNGICFSSDLDGVLNIYCLDTASGRLSELTNSAYGAKCPYVDNDGTLYYSDYSRDGYDIACVSGNSLKETAASFEKPYESPVVQTLVAQKDRSAKVESSGDSSYFSPELYPSKPYNKLLNSFHIHSWAPVYYNLDRIMALSYDYYYDLASLGATVYSQNALGNVSTMLGYSRHGRSAGHAKVVATIFDMDVEASLDVDDIVNLGLTVDYPLNLYGGGWLSMLVPSLSFNMNNDCTVSADGIRSLRAGLRYYRMLPSAESAIFPRWGGSVSAYYHQRLPMGDLFSPLAFVSGYAYFPGIIRGQGVKISAVAQHQFNALDYTYYSPSLAALPRGYKGAAPTTNYIKGSLDYAIPIWLGDATIPSVLYFKRLQLIPFGDYAIDMTSGGVRTDYWSFGASAMVDFHVLRFAPELSAGVRYSHTGPLPAASTEKRDRFDFLFGIAL